MIAFDAYYNGSEAFHIQFQTDGFSAAFGKNDAAFPDQPCLEEVVNNGRNGSLIEAGGLGKINSGYGRVFVNVTEDQRLVCALQIGGQLHTG